MKSQFSNSGQSPNRFFLPETGSFAKSVALLYRIQAFPPKDRDALLTLRKMSLGAPALSALQEKLAYTFGRFAAPSDLFYTPTEWAYVLEKKGESKAAIAEKAPADPFQELDVKEPSIGQKFIHGISRFWNKIRSPNK